MGTQDGLACDRAEMLALMRAGDLAALDRMTLCYGDQLIAIGRRHCRGEQDAHDAVQDALLSAGSNLTAFRGEGSIQGWLSRMVVHACYQMQRGQKNNPALHDAETVVADAHTDSPEGMAARGELSTTLRAALSTLSTEDRLIVLLAEGEDWTAREIAAELSLTPGAVHTRLSRARGRLRSRLASFSPAG